jgi:hypothetical protein
MENENKVCEKCENKCKCKRGGGVGGGVYGLGFVGALVYFIQNATTFWVGVLGFFKAVFWPAVLVYKLLAFLK